MFRCKKCGSEKYKLIEKGTATGLHCADCGFWHKWVAKKELYRYQGLQETKELTTAEKLLWLVANGATIDDYSIKGDTQTFIITTEDKAFPFLEIDNLVDQQTLIGAINAAYDWAKNLKHKRN